MPILEIERSARKPIPDPIIATKVSKEVQEAFDKLAVRETIANALEPTF